MVRFGLCFSLSLWERAGRGLVAESKFTHFLTMKMEETFRKCLLHLHRETAC